MTSPLAHPALRHATLSRAEMAMICDVCNPGFALTRTAFGYDDNLVAALLRANVEDSFRLYPGMYEEKWKIARETILSKLAAMSLSDLLAAANQVDRFWDDATRSTAAASLGRKGGHIGGKATSRAKSAASRRNGRRGGRPRKQE